tara:strand:- start:2015 stop:3229 length:1215 start_codon:yes stop_codon:yes gene_type:complete
MVGVAYNSNLNTLITQESCALSNILQIDNPLVRIVYPLQLQIINNNTLLKQYAYDFGNNSFSFEMKVGLFHHVDTLFIPHINVYRSQITIPTPTINTLGVQHECAYRGFVAPPKSVLIFSEKKIGEITVSSCLWKCDPSHVRQPFNKPPLLATEFSNTSKQSYSPMCIPIPTEYVATSVEMKLYVDTTSNYDMYSQKLYNAIDDLVDSLTAKAKEMGLTNPIIVIKHKGSIYDTVDFQSLLQQHSLHQNNLNSLKAYRILSDSELVQTSNTQSRRLLQSNLVQRNDIELEGLIISSQNVNQEPASFVEEVENIIESGLEEFEFESELKVSVVSKPVTTTYSRNLNVVVSTYENESYSWNRLMLFAIELGCIVIVVIRCINHSKNENEGDNIDFDDEIISKTHEA